MSGAMRGQSDREADVDPVFSQMQRCIEAGLKCRRVGTGLLQTPRPKRKTEFGCRKPHDPAFRVLFGEPSGHLPDQAGEKLVADGAPELGEAIDAERGHYQDRTAVRRQHPRDVLLQRRAVRQTALGIVQRQICHVPLASLGVDQRPRHRPDLQHDHHVQGGCEDHDEAIDDRLPGSEREQRPREEIEPGRHDRGDQRRA